jgi:hypothetical protein
MNKMKIHCEKKEENPCIKRKKRIQLIRFEK